MEKTTRNKTHMIHCTVPKHIHVYLSIQIFYNMFGKYILVHTKYMFQPKLDENKMMILN